MSLNLRLPFVLSSAFALFSAFSAQAGEKALWRDDQVAAANTRYGLFGALDHRSTYGSAMIPEPLLSDESNLETNEFRIDWSRSAKGSSHGDELTVEIEKGFGNLTLEVEFHYQWDKEGGETTEGIGNVDLAARYPIFQYVSKSGDFDTTFGVGIEVGIPTNTVVSQSTEVVPKIFNVTRFGKHVSLQTIAGYSMLYDGEEDGIHVLEYGATLAYTITHDQLAIPGVQQLIPMLEVAGEHQLNKEESGTDIVTGLVGLRANLNTIGKVQPRLGLGYAFPLSEAAREEMDWALFSSVIFEF